MSFKVWFMDKGWYLTTWYVIVPLAVRYWLIPVLAQEIARRLNK